MAGAPKTHSKHQTNRAPLPRRKNPNAPSLQRKYPPSATKSTCLIMKPPASSSLVPPPRTPWPAWRGDTPSPMIPWGASTASHPATTMTSSTSPPLRGAVAPTPSSTLEKSLRRGGRGRRTRTRRRHCGGPSTVWRRFHGGGGVRICCVSLWQKDAGWVRGSGGSGWQERVMLMQGRRRCFIGCQRSRAVDRCGTSWRGVMGRERGC